jgi:anti-sigma B factor antagonist
VPVIRYLIKMINGLPVVVAPAEIDVTTADQLRAVLLGAFTHASATVVVDMTRTRFCDSSALHTLLGAHEQVVAEGGELRLVVPAEGPVPRIFALTCLDRFVPCFASLDDALAEDGPPVPVRPSLAHRSAGLGLCAAFDDCIVTVGAGTTTLRAELPDQAALWGLIQRIIGLGLEVMDLHLVSSGP